MIADILGQLHDEFQQSKLLNLKKPDESVVPTHEPFVGCLELLVDVDIRQEP